ncbi:unnamed protein product [marine sediment metagenome]|uniref:Uncharacterized protein n=1 Tax=marine sediment metagenome TaxID=412755 RepID=X1CUX0_9ZZZZ
MPKNSLYDGQKINVSEPGEQSPEEHEECPEDCPNCAESRSPDDCKGYSCIYDKMDASTAADRKHHAMVDEGEL